MTLSIVVFNFYAVTAIMIVLLAILNDLPIMAIAHDNASVVVAGESTHVIGTLAAVYGWGMRPIGWVYALAVWGYSIACFLFNDVMKLAVYRLMRQGLSTHTRHLRRVDTPLHAPPSKLFMARR
jgi:hypothetical protein